MAQYASSIDEPEKQARVFPTEAISKKSNVCIENGV